MVSPNSPNYWTQNRTELKMATKLLTELNPNLCRVSFIRNLLILHCLTPHDALWQNPFCREFLPLPLFFPTGYLSQHPPRRKKSTDNISWSKIKSRSRQFCFVVCKYSGKGHLVAQQVILLQKAHSSKWPDLLKHNTYLHGLKPIAVPLEPLGMCKDFYPMGCLILFTCPMGGVMEK